MGRERSVQRRRELRSQQTIEVRKSKLVSSYIKTKYPAIYHEASEFYNDLVKHYPEKRDLTKTIDYKSWEINTVREAHMPNTKSLTAKATDMPNTKSLTAKATDMPNTKSLTAKATDMSNFELRIPLLELTNATNEGTARPVIQEETLDEGTAGPVTHEETPDEVTAGPVIHEETLDEGTADGLLGQIVTETVGFDVYPSILEEIEPGVLNQLFEELEADPGLKQIFETLEEEGLDIEY